MLMLNNKLNNLIMIIFKIELKALHFFFGKN